MATLIQQARIAIRERRLVEARRLLRQVVHEDPLNHAAWLLLARATPDRRLAEQYLERARHLQPDSPLVKRALDDFHAEDASSPTKNLFTWRRALAVVGIALLLGLAVLALSTDTWQQVVAMQSEAAIDTPVDSIASTDAAVEGESKTDHFPTETERADSEQINTALASDGEAKSTSIKPTIVSSSDPADSKESDKTDDDKSEDNHDVVFDPVVISGADQGLPSPILLGIESESSSRVEDVLPASEAEGEANEAEQLSRQEEILDIEIETDPETNEVGETEEIVATTEDALEDASADIAAGIETELLDMAELEQASSAAQEASEEYAVSADPGAENANERWIDVNLTTQTLMAYEGDTLVMQSLISSGMWQFPTVTGQFRTWIKYESQDMTGYHLGYNYYLEDVPYVMYFFEDYAIHGAYWHNNFGTPMSHGCVNMNTVDAGWLFDWAPLGTIVNVHY